MCIRDSFRPIPPSLSRNAPHLQTTRNPSHWSPLVASAPRRHLSPLARSLQTPSYLSLSALWAARKLKSGHARLQRTETDKTCSTHADALRSLTISASVKAWSLPRPSCSDSPRTTSCSWCGGSNSTSASFLLVPRSQARRWDGETHLAKHFARKLLGVGVDLVLEAWLGVRCGQAVRRVNLAAASERGRGRRRTHRRLRRAWWTQLAMRESLVGQRGAPISG